MLDVLFPRTASNDYRGHPVALWVFVPITLVTWGRSLTHILRFDGGAESIATIPLEQYSPAAAAVVVTMFALWGLSQLLLGAVYAAVLWRYRNLLPLMYLLLVIEYTGRFAIGAWKPIETLAAPPGATANLVFPILGAVMLFFATRVRRDPT